MKEIYFLSANGVYELCTEDYLVEKDIPADVWQAFTDRLGEVFAELDDDIYYSERWNALHQQVCREFSQIFE